MDEKELKVRTKRFAYRCVKIALALKINTLGNHVRKQLIKSSTSVASNYRASYIKENSKRI